MKKQSLAAVSVCLMFVMLMFVPSAPAADDAKPAVTPEAIRNRPTRESRPAPADARRRDRRNLKRLDEGFEQRQRQQQNFIAELKAIKELALKEGATKTAKRLEAVIKQQQERSTKTMKSVTRSRGRLREQFAEEHLPKSPKKEEAKQDVKEDVKEESEGDGKWWQFWK